jgi:hypothetical protein
VITKKIETGELRSQQSPQTKERLSELFLMPSVFAGERVSDHRQVSISSRTYFVKDKTLVEEREVVVVYSHFYDDNAAQNFCQVKHCGKGRREGHYIEHYAGAESLEKFATQQPPHFRGMS